MTISKSTDETRQKVRALLWKWGHASAKTLRIQNDIGNCDEKLASMADPHRAIADGQPRGTVRPDPTATAAERLARVRAQYQQRIDELNQELLDLGTFCAAIDDVVRMLPESELAIVVMRYKSEFKMEYIAKECHYSLSRVDKIERKAVDFIGEHVKFDQL